MQLSRVFLSCLIMAGMGINASSQTVQSGSFRVGAAKVDITPAAGELPKQYLGILDKLYARAIVIDNGHTGAALITLDTGMIANPVVDGVKARIEKELGIPAVNVYITATHTHSAPMAKDMQQLIDKVFASAKEAKTKVQPAKISYGKGLSYVNVQRDLIDPNTHRWWEGANYDGLSDKTVAIIKFVSLSGDPIAVYYNYAVHGVITGNLDLVSGDIPGATSRYIETALGDKAVAVWSEGACGDQNPIYFQQTYDLRDIRVKDYAKRGEDISNSMPPGGVGLDRSNPEVARLMNEQKQMILSMGQMLGEEVLRAMRESKVAVTEGRLFGKETTVTCPGRDRTNQGRGGYEGAYKDGAPVQIKLGLLMIDDIAIGAVNAEVYNEIAQRLKKESPYAKTMMTTITNGITNSGYIPDDASFGHYTFEVLSSRLQPGCAETQIVDGIVGMMPKISY
jgi:neutral ceramidase